MPVLKCEGRLLQENLVGKVFLITGGNSGIGLEAVKQLSKQGGTVVFTSRNLEAGKQIETEINSKLTLGNKVEVMKLDLSDLASVEQFTKEFKQKYTSLHVLINNGGVMNIPKLSMSKNQVEMQFATNHLGHFHLTNLLLDLLKSSAPSRIVIVSSRGHYEANGKYGAINFEDVSFQKRPYDGFTAYAQSKLANVLHALELARRLRDTGVVAVSLHPGWVRTSLMRNTMPLWVQNCLCTPLFRKGGMIEPWDGVQTSLFCALDPSITSHSGEYYSQMGKYGPKGFLSGWPMVSPCKEVTEDNAAKLWALSESLVVSGQPPAN